MLTILAVIIIATAVLVGIGRALIPYADELRPWLVQVMSERLGEPVSIGRVEAQWPRLTPKLTLHQVIVGDGADPLLHVDQARLELHLPNLLDSERNLLELIILGLDLVLEEDVEGRWGLRLEGGARLGGEERGDDRMPFGDLAVRDARLSIRARNGLEVSARLTEGDVRRRGPDTLVRGRLVPGQAEGNALEVSLLMSRANGRWQRGRAWLNGQDLLVRQWLAAPWLPESTRLSMEAWADWTDEQGGRLDADLSLDGFEAGAPPLVVELVAGRENRVSTVELVRLDLGVESPTPVARGLAMARHDEDWALAVDWLDLAPVHRLLSPWLSERRAWPERVSGRVEALQAGWRFDRGLQALEGRLEDLDWRIEPRFPSVSGLSLELGLDGDRPVLTPHGQPRVVWASMFREPIEIERVAGRALLSPLAVELQDVALETAFLAGATHGWLIFNQRKPFVDLYIQADRVGPLDPRRFLPLRYIPPKADAWLNRSMEWVEQASGEVVLHMQAGTRARQIRLGHFECEVEFQGVSIDYWPDWPRASRLAGQASFVGRSMAGRIERGRLGALALDSADLNLGDLTEPELALEIRSGERPGEDVAGLLGELPFEVWQRSLAPMQWSGPVEIDTRMRLPFRRMEDWWLEGEASLREARLRLPDAGLEFEGLSGTVGFDRRALGPATLELAPGPGESSPARLDLVASFAEPAWLQLSGHLNPIRVLAEAGTLADRISGRTDVEVEVSPHDYGGLGIEIESDLSGLSINLPEPLAKPRELAWPSSATLRVDDEEQSLRLRVADWLLGLAERRGASWRAGLRVGTVANQVPGWPGLPEHGLSLQGQLDHLNPVAWQRLMRPAVDALDAEIAQDLDAEFDLQIGTLEFGGALIESVDLSLEREASSWHAWLEGPDLAGELIVPVPLDSGRVVVADLQRLSLDPVEPVPESADLASQPLSSQTSSVNPIGLPPLHVLIEDLRWGNLNLGRARLESHPSAEGVEVELIDVSGPDLRLNGNGRWVMRDGRAESQFIGRLTTDEVEGLLESAGYQAALNAERTQLEVDLRWPGAPLDFELGRLSGVLDLQIADGTIPEARPGAGRLLGLGSLTALPRRLTLDFRDVFGSGLKFDQIEGRFDLAAGFARTDALVVYSPAARITISGDTDMAARRYDQQVRVEPGIGGTLPVIGVLAGGPVGAAAGLVLQSILDRPLRGIAEARYTVTGPWHEPLIELVEARVTDEAGEETVIGPPPPD